MSRLIYPHLPERVMQQFGYMLFVLKDPFDYDPLAMAHRDVDAMCDDFHNHMIPNEVRITLTLNYWSFAYVYIQWYFRVSHPHMTLNALGDALRSAHLEILEKDQAR